MKLVYLLPFLLLPFALGASAVPPMISDHSPIVITNPVIVEQEAVARELDQLHQEIQKEHQALDTAVVERNALIGEFKSDVRRELDNNAKANEQVLLRINELITRLSSLEASGSPVALQTEKGLSLLAERVTAIESRGQGIGEVWSILLAVGGLMVGAISSWSILHRINTGNGNGNGKH